MISIDTNILLRFLVDDDLSQAEAARSFMKQRTADDPIFISSVVLAETVWFLRQRFEYSKSQVVDMLRLLVSVPEVMIEHMEELELLLAGPAFPSADIADYFVAWASLKAGCSKIVTFDRKATGIPGMELLA